MNYLIIIVLGLIIGSFLNVIILRFDDLATVVTGRSHCPKCQKNLLWYELIPVISYIALRGKCSQCKKPISFQYPLVEAGTAAIFALIYWYFGFSFVSCILYLVSCILVVIFVYDILYQEIPDLLVISAAIIWALYLVIGYFFLQTPNSQLLASIFGSLALGGFLALLAGVSREKWMGYGDIGLGALLGFILGWPNVLVGGFLAFLIGAIVGLVLIALKQSKFQSKLPFAPFLVVGFYIALFWGQALLIWYTNLIKG